MKRRLSPQERDLWRRLTETVRPLFADAAPQPEPAPQEDAAPPAPPGTEPAPAPAAPAGAPRPATPRPAALAPIEPRLRRRLARGGAEVDARLDLHGMTQERAHRVLLAFLRESRMRDRRIVLVITGKGGGEARGVLRRSVPLWLATPELRDLVVGFENAGRRHGGEGALYVRLRRGQGA